MKGYNDGEFEAVFLRTPYYMEQSDICKFNRNVDCNEGGKRCTRCGWNPEVSEARLRKIKERLGIGGVRK